MQDTITLGGKAVLSTDALQALIALLTRQGYAVIGPRVRDGAIVYDEIASFEDLPAGMARPPGRRALPARAAGRWSVFRLCGRAAILEALPASARSNALVRAKDADGFSIARTEVPAPKLAFLGVRACELDAIAIQDRVFCDGPYRDEAYAARRANVFIVAVNCGQAGGTCFCVSMQTGPKAETGFDLAPDRACSTASSHEFLVEAGSEAGAALLAELPHAPATAPTIAAAEAVIAHTREPMGRELGHRRPQGAAASQSEPSHAGTRSPARCLACGNCTMVCPTCFLHHRRGP